MILRATNKWIRSSEGKSHISVVAMNDVNLMKTIENGIRTGRPCLIESVGESLESAIDPILMRNVYKQGGRTLIRIGDADVDYDGLDSS